jgi:RPA family protein
LSQNYRIEELQLYVDPTGNYEVMVVQYDDTQLNALLSIVMTTFVIMVMVTGALFFNKDSNELVVIPIENMLRKVRRIIRNPLEAAILEED